jgi:hypothetical protein
MRELYRWFPGEFYARNLTKTRRMVSARALSATAFARRLSQKNGNRDEHLAYGAICAIGAEISRGEVGIDGSKQCVPERVHQGT